MGKPSRNERFSSAILDYPENDYYIVFCLEIWFWIRLFDTIFCFFFGLFVVFVPYMIGVVAAF